MQTTYEINMTDSETPSPWMGAGHIVSLQPGNQDSGYCRWTVITTDPTALEAAFDADDLVLEYEAAPPPTIAIEISCGSPSVCSDTAGATDYDVTLTIDGVDTEGNITLWPDLPNGGHLSACGTPPDIWVSGALMAALRPLGQAHLRRVLKALESCDSGDVSLSD